MTRLGQMIHSRPVLRPAFCTQHADPRISEIPSPATCATLQSSSRTENESGARNRLVA
jgi:hypothetical protein